MDGRPCGVESEQMELVRVSYEQSGINRFNNSHPTSGSTDTPTDRPSVSTTIRHIPIGYHITIGPFSSFKLHTKGDFRRGKNVITFPLLNIQLTTLNPGQT